MKRLFPMVKFSVKSGSTISPVTMIASENGRRGSRKAKIVESPTEVILEHTDGPLMASARIIPHTSRIRTQRETLQAFQADIQDFD